MRRLRALWTFIVMLLPRLLGVMSFCLVLRRARRLCMTPFLMLRGASLLRTRRFHPALFNARLFNTSRFHRSVLFSARLLRAMRLRSVLFDARLLRAMCFRSAFFYARLFQPSLQLPRSLLVRRLVQSALARSILESSCGLV